MISLILLLTVHAGWDCSTVLDLHPSGIAATVTYDLSRFQKVPAQRFRHIPKNSDANSLGKYDWYFEICGDTAEIPHEHECCDQAWKTPGSNVEQPAAIEDDQTGFLDNKYLDGDTPIFMRGPGPAWQVELDDSNSCTRCYRLGRSYSFTQNSGLTNQHGTMTWGLMSDVNPTEGVYIEYHEGDTEIPGCDNRNRQLRIVFECNPSAPADESNSLDKQSAFVTEEPLCTYTIKFKSTAGCPVECPHRVRDGVEHLCDGHGHCEIDAGLQKPRCFCDVGWTGNDCGTKSNDEIAMATDRCYPLPNGGYMKGSCNGDASMYSASKYTDAECTDRQSGPNNFVTDSCTNIYGLEASAKCLVNNGPAVIDMAECSSSSQSSSSSSSSWGVGLTLLIILLVGLGVAVGYLVYKQMSQPDLKNFLVLNDDNTTQL